MNITVTPHGRTGNRLMQYALALVLAKDKKYNFNAEHIPYFDQIEYTSHVQNDLNTFKTSTFGNHYYDYNYLLSCNSNINIDSYVQQSYGLIPHRDYLRQQFGVLNTLDTLPEDDELVIHIRETDYKVINAYLGDNMYTNLVKNSKFSKNTIVTDNINSPLIKELASLGCTVFTKQQAVDWQYPFFSKNELDDFNYLLHSKNLFISQSTFSWWAAFLGNHNQIIFPYMKTGGMWPLNPTQDDVNLYFDFGVTSKYIL